MEFTSLAPRVGCLSQCHPLRKSCQPLGWRSVFRPGWLAQRAPQGRPSKTAVNPVSEAGSRAGRVGATQRRGDLKNWPSELRPLHATPSEVVEGYYKAINSRRLADALALYAEDCTHHNLAYNEPAVGKKAVSQFVYDFCRNIPVDLQFRIDDISAGRSVGVIWHMEIGSVELPLGKGMSFYQLDAHGKITYVRESPEHFAKFASVSPMALRLTAPFLRNMGPTGDVSDIASSLGDEFQRVTSAFFGSASSATSSLLSTLDMDAASVSIPAPDRIPDIALTGGMEPTAEGGHAEDFSGVWIKDTLVSSSSDYDKALRLMGMTGIMKVAVEALIGMDLQQEADTVRMKYLASVPNFPEIIEEYRYGAWSEVPRRDMQRGWQRVRADVLQDGRLQLQVQLGPAGWATADVYEFVSPDLIHVHSRLVKGEERADVTFSYRRRK